MTEVQEYSVEGKHAPIATMYNKERVIRPLLQLTLGLPCVWCGVPTDAVRLDVSLLRGAGAGSTTQSRR